MNPRLPAFDSSVSVSRFLLRSLKEQWKDYRREFDRSRRRCSEESVHEVRIAIRRLLSTLSLLEPLLPSEPLFPAELLLRKRLKTFARLRDTHVQSLELKRLEDPFPDAKAFREVLAPAGAAADQAAPPQAAPRAARRAVRLHAGTEEPAPQPHAR